MKEYKNKEQENIFDYTIFPAFFSHTSSFT